MKYNKILFAVVFLMFSYTQGFSQSNDLEPSSEVSKIEVKTSEKEQKATQAVKTSDQLKQNKKQQAAVKKSNKVLNLNGKKAVLNAAPKRKKQ